MVYLLIVCRFFHWWYWHHIDQYLTDNQYKNQHHNIRVEYVLHEYNDFVGWYVNFVKPNDVILST